MVDDGSAQPEAVRAAIARALLTVPAQRPPVKVVEGCGRGPAAARNAGARAACGTIVCFTDDDCVAGPDWVARLTAACDASGAAAGTTVAGRAAGHAAAASQLLTHTLQVASLDRASGALGFAPSCNLACRADIARALPFDEAYPLAAGEDRDWCDRLAAAGFALRFEPDALVEHRPRLGLGGLLRQQARYGHGAVRFRSGRGGRRLSGRVFYRRLARDAWRAGPAVAALVALAQVAVAAGALCEAFGRRPAQR